MGVKDERAREELDLTVYAIVQLKMTDRAAYDRYQARFFYSARIATLAIALIS